MRFSKAAAAVATLLFFSSAGLAGPLTEGDVQALNGLQRAYVQGWLRNDRDAVMGLMADDAVFIPHDGVMPRVGASAISEFWFPGGRAVGRVPAYDQQISNISGDDHQATIYGRFSLHYETDDTRYNWIGNFLIVARKDQGRWRISHMMANDADPTIERIRPSTP